MLQRAANNAYSWWWASHIRTKQSKWLDQNLQDMEEKVSSMLKIIENDADTFTQRVELYFKKRPELVNHVQESYRAYRALAEKFDHLSKDMQSANRTIAAVFPEQFQYTLEDDEEFTPGSSTASTPSLDPEKFPNFPKNISRKVPILKKELPNMADPSSNAASLTKEEAQEEIIKIHKEMLALQTEREFLESIIRRCSEKSGGIELQITDMQAKVGKLQDKFGCLEVIDDDEARSLMAATALKSCKDSFSLLQEKQEQSTDKIEQENRRVREIANKFTSLRSEILSDQGTEVSTDDQESERESRDELDSESIRAKITEEIEVNSSSSSTVMELADKINELVETVTGLETAASTQDAQINVLRLETDGLQQQVKRLEEEKAILKEDAENLRVKMKEMEEELNRVKSLCQSVKDQNEKLQTQFIEAKCCIDHLSEKLQNAEIKIEAQKVTKESDTVNVKGLVQREIGRKPYDHQKDDKSKDFAVESINPEHKKALPEEFGLVDRNYAEVRQRLSDVEKKNRDGFFELILQIRELKSELAAKDKEIESLKTDRFTETNKDKDQNRDTNSTEFHQRGAYPESLTHTASGHTQSTESLGDFAATLLPNEKGELDEMIKKTVSTIEDKFRSEIDELLEGNLEFWMRFSNSLSQVDKFRSSVKDLKAELAKLKESAQEEEGNIIKSQSTTAETKAIYKHLSQIQTELKLWLENNSGLKEETRSKNEALLSLNEEIIKLSNPNPKDGESGLNRFQAAKFLGEIMNMKQESDKVSEELQAGRTCIILLKEEVEKTLTKIDEELGIDASNQGPRRSRIPLRSFLFGVKLKKQKSNKSSILACIQPGLQESGQK